MSYPKRLLPDPLYKKITWNEILRNQFLIHHTKTKDLIDPKTEKLLPSLVALRRDHLRDYSNSLLGVFLIDDVYWAIQPCDNKDYLIEEWIEGDSVIPPKVPLEIKKDLMRGYFFLNINNCHEAIVPYEDGTEIKPVCRVLHTPTNSNFWHFSLRWFCNGVDVLEWSESERRRVLTAAKAFFVEKAFFDEPFFEEIPSEFYCNI